MCIRVTPVRDSHSFQAFNLASMIFNFLICNELDPDNKHNRYHLRECCTSGPCAPFGLVLTHCRRMQDY
jgi:hypothetical protein